MNATPATSGPGSLFRKHPSAFLLAAQLSALLIYPAMEGTTAGRAAYEIFGIMVLCLATMVVRHSRVPVPFIIANGAVAAGFSIGSAVHPMPWLVAVSAALLRFARARANSDGLAAFATVQNSSAGS